MPALSTLCEEVEEVNFCVMINTVHENTVFRTTENVMISAEVYRRFLTRER